MLKRICLKASQLFGQPSDWLGQCLLCQQACDQQPLLCSHCQHALYQQHTRCRLCAAPLVDTLDNPVLLCGQCQKMPPPWQQLQVIGAYQAPYHQLISRLKYHREWLLAPLLAQLLVNQLDLTDPPEVILPVPLHWWRRWRRGFNQAQEIALHVSALTNIPCNSHLLRRVKATASQTQLNAVMRRKNLHAAFAIRPHHYRHVALLDDVVTTGTTAGELCQLLHQSGVSKVQVWALCRTAHPRG